MLRHHKQSFEAAIQFFATCDWDVIARSWSRLESEGVSPCYFEEAYFLATDSLPLSLVQELQVIEFWQYCQVEGSN